MSIKPRPMPLRHTASRALRRACCPAALLLTGAAAPAPAAERIPASIGKQGSGSFLVSTAGRPASVSLGRFDELASSSGARWGLRARALTGRGAGNRDGLDVVGFGRNVPAGALAIERDYVVRVYRVVKRCRVRARRRFACKTVRRRYVGRRVDERDVTVRPDVEWQPGPGYPGPAQYDLETVLIHELGHFAGNPDHAPRCVNSPLMESLAPGDWWRSQSDWHVDGCPQPQAAAAGARARPAPTRLAHERIVVGERRVY
jgi:hypothetical protein